MPPLHSNNMPPPEIPELSLSFITIFKQDILPIFPILSLQDINHLLVQYASSNLTVIELVCLSLLVETGSLLSTLREDDNPSKAMYQLRSSNIANIARCLDQEKQFSLAYVQACLLMDLFLRQAAQPDEHYLIRASSGLKMLSSDTQLSKDLRESLSLAWLSLTCLTLYVL
jgi:hypothetical protein